MNFNDHRPIAEAVKNDIVQHFFYKWQSDKRFAFEEEVDLSLLA